MIQWGPSTRETSLMPNTPIALQTPDTCMRCGSKGTIELEHTIKGTRISLTWHCTVCDEEWPVRRKEEVGSE